MQVQLNVARLYDTLVKYEDSVEVDERIIAHMEGYLENCIAAGANIHQMIDGVHGDTLLHQAVRNGRVCVIAALLHKGANPDAPNLCDKTPRQMASNKPDLHKFFPVKEEVNRPIFEFTTLVMEPQSYFKVVKAGNLKAIEFFISNGGRNILLSRDDQGRTALHMAAMAGHDAIVERLLDVDIGSDTKDKDGRTALFLASQNGHAATVKLLLKRCGGRNDTDHFLNTPLHLAAVQGHLAVVSLLAVSPNNEHVSASVKMRNREGLRPVDIGAANVLELLRFLEELDNKTK